MKNLFCLVCVCISMNSFAQIKELGISKLFADTCTINFLKPDSGQFIRTYPRNFLVNADTAKHTLKVDDLYFDTLAMIIDALPGCIIEIGSHTESNGPDKKNLTVSKQKATNTLAYLVRICAVKRSQLRARGYGETQLLNACDDDVPCSESENLKNRRIELKIVGFTK
ncbi:MAG: OmpA family protein [Chitinophagales bacterium]|nr:OmpA family protein [Chitinophagales bacterium]